jgi:hypothetical protein
LINARVDFFLNSGFLSVPSDCDFRHPSISNRGLRLLSIHATGDDRAFEDPFDGLGDSYVVSYLRFRIFFTVRLMDAATGC